MATNRSEVYKCEVCGNMVEILHAADGELVCCGQAMTKLNANSVDASKEKHVPVIEKKDGGFLGKVGSVAHPMTAEHSIEWIELLDGERILRQYLKPGDKPEAFFASEAAKPEARAYCNLHGLWKN